MRILQRTPTQLTIQNSPHRVWLISGFLATVGISIFSIPTTSPSDHLGVQIHAYFFILLGIITLLSSGQFITWTFDKSDNSLLVQSRSLFITKTSEYKLTEIRNVRTTSRSNEGEPTFGIELVLTEEEKLQLCPGFSLSNFTAKEGVRRISSFLELRQ